MNEQKLDESRLGDEDIFTNIGPTLLLGTGFLLFIVMIVVLLVLICRKRSCSPKCKERVEKQRKKMLFNPIIRYCFLNAFKLNLNAMLALQ